MTYCLNQIKYFSQKHGTVTIAMLMVTTALWGTAGCVYSDDDGDDYDDYDDDECYGCDDWIYYTPEALQCAYEQCGGGRCEWNEDVLSCSQCPANRSGAKCELLPPCTGVIAFGSVEVESAVRLALSIPEAEITAAELRKLETLTVVATRFDRSDGCTESCDPYPFRDLTGLHCAANLKELRLNNVTEPDVTPLENLTKLQLLEIGTGSNITSPVMVEKMSALSKIPELKTLLLSGIFSSPDLTFLSPMVTLTTLTLGNSRITDVRPLGTLTNLTSLKLEYNQITDISGLSTLVNLTDLNLCGNQVRDITPLSPLVNLTNLDASRNEIRVVSGLSTLVNLVSLNLEFNFIVNVSGLSALEHLNSLNLNGNHIFEVDGLSTLVNLTALDLSSNLVRDIGPLATLVNLISLNIHTDNVGPDELKFSNVSPLNALVNLTTLDLSGNRISDVSGLSPLVNLTQLDLRNTMVSDVRPLSRLVNLRELYIDLDNISDPSPVYSLENLRINP